MNHPESAFDDSTAKPERRPLQQDDRFPVAVPWTNTDGTVHEIRVGATVSYRKGHWVVVAVALAEFGLRSLDHLSFERVAARELFMDSDFEVIVEADPDDPDTEAANELQADGVPDWAIDLAVWRLTHLHEVQTGFRNPYDPQPDEPCPAYGPDVPKMDRWANKATELADAVKNAPPGSTVRSAPTAKTLQRWWTNYGRSGLAGLIDSDARSYVDPLAGCDPLVRKAIEDQHQAEVTDSTGTRHRFRLRAEQRVRAVCIAEGRTVPTMPTPAQFDRYIALLENNRGTFGDAQTRRTILSRPNDRDGKPQAYKYNQAAMPGDLVEMDSSALDVKVLDEYGNVVFAEITYALDRASRSILAWHLGTHSTKAVDVSFLLAQMMVPEPMRPGWDDALRFRLHVLGTDSLMTYDERLRLASMRPFCVPGVINVDHGKVFMSPSARDGARTFGIGVQPSRPGTPTDKSKVERTFTTIGTMFSQFFSGYTGGRVSRRGKRVEDGAAFRIEEVEELFAQWVVGVYQRKEHAGLRVPGTSGRLMSPNMAWEAGIAAGAVTTVPKDPTLYQRLLPRRTGTISHDGIAFRRFKYNSTWLQSLPKTSPYTTHGGRWPFRWDSGDRSRIWIQDPVAGVWHDVPWVHAPDQNVPYSDVLVEWAMKVEDAARRNRKATQLDIANRLRRIHAQAESGELTKAESKVVALDRERTDKSTQRKDGIWPEESTDDASTADPAAVAAVAAARPSLRAVVVPFDDPDDEPTPDDRPDPESPDAEDDDEDWRIDGWESRLG